MEQKSSAEKRALDAQTLGHSEAKRISDEAWKHSEEAYKEAKKQADVVYEAVKKIAVDKQAKQAADEAHKEALEQAKKLRDAIIAEGQAVFRVSYDKADADYIETTTKSLKTIKDANEAYKEAEKQADIIHKEAKKTAVDKQAKQAADEAHKKAIEQAKKARDEATRESR
jgi:colicin import membrane protein